VLNHKPENPFSPSRLYRDVVFFFAGCAFASIVYAALDFARYLYRVLP